MRDSSNEDSNGRSFIGFYTDPAVKETAERRAEEEGVSLSELMRRRLGDLDDAAERTAVTA